MCLPHVVYSLIPWKMFDVSITLFDCKQEKLIIYHSIVANSPPLEETKSPGPPQQTE